MRRTAAPYVALGAAALGAALTADVVHHGIARRLDLAVHDAAAAHLHGAVLRAGLTVLSWPGQRGLVVVPLLLVAGLSARQHATARPVVVVAGALAATALSVWLFKAGVGRLSPGSGRDVVHADGISYPSGHAVNAVLCWGLVMEYAAGLSDRLRRVFSPRRRATGTALLAAAAGLAMVALDYHWLSDVVAGWLLGIALLAAALAMGTDRGWVSRPADRGRPAEPERARPAPSA